MDKVILVTGGCGYIGTRLVPTLVASGWRVRVLDLLYFGNCLPRTVYPSEKIELIIGDIRDDRAVAAALEGADAVIHLAAMSNDPSAEVDPEFTRSINLDAALNLIRRAKRQGIKRFLNASTATVYGIRDESDVMEETEHGPITLYGKYKSETDHFLTSESDRNFVVVNLRAATVCGWSQRMRFDLTVNIFAAQAASVGRIRVHGGQQRRPNVVIDDLVGAYLSLLGAGADTVRGESFNICSSNHKVIDLAQMVSREVDGPCEVVVEPIVDMRSYHISAAKIANKIGFRCQYDVRDGARQVVDAIRGGHVSDVTSSRYVNIRHLVERGVVFQRTTAGASALLPVT